MTYRPGSAALYALAVLACVPAGARAQSFTLPEISVAASTPVPGPGIERDKLPFDSRVLDASAVQRHGPPDALRALEESVGAVTLSNAQNNPFQPSLLYRGFEASPLGGNAQGLAVYLNGARFNQPFGDTVNFDLIPDLAIDRITLEGANPAFGLNALGGALAIQLKNGFTFHGTEATALGGSFGRYEQTFQHGQQIGNTGIYVAERVLGDDGYRAHSPSRLRQIYADIGHKVEGSEFHLNYIGAWNSLVGNGSTPVELLALDRNAVFTYPDRTRNEFGRIGLQGNIDVSKDFSLQTNLYYGRLRQQTQNGDATQVGPCATDPAILCDDAGAPIRGAGGGPVPNSITASPFSRLPAFADRFPAGGPYALLNRTSTDSTGFGGTLQGTYTGDLFGHPNRLVMGGSFDGGFTRFGATSEVGGLTLDRGFAGPGTIFSTEDNAITPVDVRARNLYGGLYLQDVFDVTDRLAVNVGGRFNIARIQLRDQLGTALNGDHSFQRFNPNGGLSYKVTPNVTAYAGYSEANRAPTPAELSCADPAAPCSLTNFFVGDPPLKQVVARTVEAGLRGTVPAVEGGAALTWKAGYYRTQSSDDIQFVSSPTPGRAYFQNVGTTLRQGVEIGAGLTAERWSAFVEYALTDATFQTPLTLNAPLNPFASPNPADPGNPDAGIIQVRPGDRLPRIPLHSVKLGLEVLVTPEWKIGLTARAFSGRYLVGDEANLNRPTAPYGIINLSTSYQVTKNIQVFGLVENLLDAKYATFGTFSPVTQVPIVGLANASDPRSLSIGPPLGAYAGVKITF
jgi:iron complex outermembrane receptor protein